jgi:hypothetical protein
VSVTRPIELTVTVKQKNDPAGTLTFDDGAKEPVL